MSVYCGREFSPNDIQTIKLLIEHNPSLKRTPLSRKRVLPANLHEIALQPR